MICVSSTDIYGRIASLKNKRNAVIFAHYYQPCEVQKVADIVGDSFQLAKYAEEVENEVIVMCGVRFMAETAKILSPEKTVLLPKPDAGCSMADMVTPADVRKLRQFFPKAAVMCYVNTSAAVKAECDICCTSSSAVKAAESLKQRQIIFLPDKNLGGYIRGKVPEKEFILWDGCCPVHNSVTEKDFTNAKNRHPEAEVLVHPECTEGVQKMADFVGSTSEIISRISSSNNKGGYIIGTEAGVYERLREIYPEKSIYQVSNDMVCADMKKTGLQDIVYTLETGTFEINLPEDILLRSRASLEKMMVACG